MQTALFSHYIIDGVHRELTPAAMLDAILEPSSRIPVEARLDEPCPETVVDETLDTSPFVAAFEPSRIQEYLAGLDSVPYSMPLPFAAQATRFEIAQALINTIWKQGRFKLDDLNLTAKWTWHKEHIGDMAAFYASAEAAADFTDALGLCLRRYALQEGEHGFSAATPFSGAGPIVLSSFVPDPQSWIIYIPFDTSDYRLGGSLLSQSLSMSGGVAPLVEDADYFIDCYEVVRELVEDGILLSGATVGHGGLARTLKHMTSEGVGARADIHDVMRAFEEYNPVRILFAEVPGVVLQVRDIDFDYIDAELLLQDVAFFPLGHPNADGGGLELQYSAKSGIQTILDSLLSQQSTEGED